jgi:hypothetical protein
MVTAVTTRFKHQNLHSADRVNVCDFYGSQNIQHLLPYTALTDFVVTKTECVYRAVLIGSLNIAIFITVEHNNPLLRLSIMLHVSVLRMDHHQA